MSDKLIDNDGYYQDVDEARYCHLDMENEEPKKEKAFTTPVRITPERYGNIEYNPLTRYGRRKFCNARHAIHRNSAEQYAEDIKNGTYNNLPPTQGFYQCKNCKGGFVAKKADRKRGWARFCSKSCKAQY